MRYSSSLRVVGVWVVLAISGANAEPRDEISKPAATALASLVSRYGVGSPGYRRSAPPVAVFDWDDTVAYNDSSEFVFDRALRHLELPIGSRLGSLLPESLAGRARRAPILASLRAARDGSEDAARAFRAEMHLLYRDLGSVAGRDEQYRWFSKLFAGRSERELTALAREAIAEGCAEALASESLAAGDGSGEITVERGLRIYRPQADLIGSLRAAGWDVWIVSAGIEPIIRTFAERVGVPPDHVIGVRLRRGPGARLLPAIVEPFPYAAGKVLAIERFIRAVPRLVAGDSSGDVPMLRLASDARLVVARDESSAAVKAARAEDWNIVTPDELLDRSRPPGHCGLENAR